MYKVSVIIPIYKVKQEYLEACLDTVCHQTLKEIEIIIVDDCGKDGSMTIVKSYKAKDARIKVIQQENNKGAGDSRNKGIQAAQGEYVGFVDSDDLIKEDFYELLYKEAKKRQCDFVKGINQHLSTGEISGLGRKIIEGRVDVEQSLSWFTYEHTSAIYRRELLLDHNIQYGKTRVSEDITFLLQVNYYAKKKSICKQAIYQYRRNREGSLTAVSYKENMNQYVLAMAERIAFINAHTDIPKEIAQSLIGGYLMRLEYWRQKYFEEYSKIEVSVVIPIYNGEAYIVPLLTTLLKQSLKAIEIICVDDGSTDQTKVKIQQLMKEDSRISYYYQENKGAGIARNLGLRQGKGKYIIFLDVDDLYQQSLLEKLWRRAKETGAEVVTCLYEQDDYWLKEHRENLGYIKERLPQGDIIKPQEVSNLLRAFTQGPINKLFRRDFLIDNHITFGETRIANDVKLTSLALIQAQKIALLDEQLILVRRYMNKQSISSNRGKYIEQAIIAYRDLYQCLEKRGLASQYKAQIRQLVTDAIYYNGRYAQSDKLVQVMVAWLKESPWKEMTRQEIIKTLKLQNLKPSKRRIELLKKSEMPKDEDAKHRRALEIQFTENQLANLQQLLEGIEQIGFLEK